MAKRNDAVLKKIAALGVTNPKKPTAQEIKVILDAYVRTKELDVKSFEIYRGLIDSSLRTIFDGFSAFSKDETVITATTLDIIRQALTVLQTELERKPSSKEWSSWSAWLLPVLLGFSAAEVEVKTVEIANKFVDRILKSSRFSKTVTMTLCLE